MLLDKQVNVQLGERFYRFTRKILNRSGAQNASPLMLSFDPTFESFCFHRLEIRRGDQALNALQPEKIEVLQREKNLERHLYDGELSILAMLNDIRVGDQLEYSYTIRGTNPVFAGHYSDTVWLAGPVAIQYLRYRLLTPAARPMQLYYEGEREFERKPTIRDENGMKEYLVSIENVPAIVPELSLPRWYNPYPQIEVTEFKSWKEVADWAVRLFASNSPLSAELEGQIERWKAITNEEQRIVAALEFVQDEVRYLGIEVGPHTHQPYEPSVVFARRSGDCKDKARLFCVILQRLGVEAAPALVNHVAALDPEHPTPRAFNHVIAVLKTKNGEFWVDPTLAGQRGSLAERHCPDYVHALVARHGTTALSKVAPSTKGLPKTTVRESFTVKGTNQPTELRVVTTMEGSDAERFRAIRAESSVDEIAKARLSSYARIFPLIEAAKPMEVVERESQVQLIELYSVNDFWNSKNGWQWQSEFDARSIAQCLNVPSVSRRMPLGMYYHPCRKLHITTVNLPDSTPLKDEHEFIGGPADELIYKRVSSGRVITLEYDYRTKTDSVPVAKLKEHFQARQRMLDCIGTTLTWRPRTEALTNKPMRSSGIGWWITVGFAAVMVGIFTVIHSRRSDGEI